MTQSQLAKKIGKLMVVGFPGKAITSEVKNLIHDYHIGAIILFSRNIGTKDEVYTLTRDLQNEAKQAGYERPLFICLDQENGIVRRLGEGTTLFPGAMALGATEQPKLAYDVSFATGKELKALGINWNLAPVLDVNNNPDNPVIGVRSFSESPDKVAEFGRAAMQGMQDAGVITTLKHFPGHGDTNVDSHLDLPMIAHDLKRLKQVELKPFKACIEEGADVVMTAHVHFPAIESEKNRPATLSKNVLTHLLREKLNYNGVITTDCMEMDAIADTVGTEQGAVEAIKAGADFIMVSHTMERQIGAIHAIETAIKHGEIDEETINQSVQRINQLLDKYMNWEDCLETKQHTQLAKVGSRTHRELARKAYEQSVTIVKNNDILPLESYEKSSILVLQPSEQLMTRVEDATNVQTLGDAVKHYYPGAHTKEIDQMITESHLKNLINQASAYDYVILGTLAVNSKSQYIELVEAIKAKGVHIIGIGMRNPYDAYYLKGVDAFINTYEPTFSALKIACGAIFGQVQVDGKLPVTIK